MIAQDFGFTGNFLKERNNSAYFRLKKIPCGFKEQARARHTGEKFGLAVACSSGRRVVGERASRHGKISLDKSWSQTRCNNAFAFGPAPMPSPGFRGTRRHSDSHQNVTCSLIEIDREDTGLDPLG